ncbi:hypothetical protein AB3X91_30825 [Paraburkholderia sp. BR14263]|uniref:hypothetical protein n=1 Tax=unclassified Paraburkholderia TaxID=2615204 RepID=UPI0034CE1825
MLEALATPENMHMGERVNREDLRHMPAVDAEARELARQIREDHHGFVYGDMWARERFVELLIGRAPDCFRQREKRGALIFTVRREGAYRILDLYEVAADRLGIRWK